MPVRPDEIRTFLREVFAPTLAGAEAPTEGVDAVLLEVKNFKNVHNLNPSQVLFQSIQVLLDASNLHRHPNPEDWHDCIKKTFRPFGSLWQYTRAITDQDDRSECLFDLYDYCQNQKRPHLKRGFPYIVTSLLAGDIVCPIAAASFVDAMLRSDEANERDEGHALQPFLSRSCPW